MHGLDKIRQLPKFDSSFNKPVEEQKINYDNVILTISFYTVISFLKEIVNFMT
jgi:protoporphyrinogen oxidase